MKKKSYVKSLFFLVIGSLIVIGGSFRGYHYFHNSQALIRNSKLYLINGIFQTCPQKEAVSTAQLAEMLQLSLNLPTHLLDFDEKEAKKRLLNFPIFKTVEVSKKKPSHIFIDYTIRTPLMIVKDYHDALIDEEGVVFPYKPFFSEKLLPKCYIGLGQDQLGNEKKKLAIEVLKISQKYLKSLGFQIHLIDVSQAFLDSYSKKEIVLTINQSYQGVNFDYYLRLASIDLDKQFSNFLVLSKELQKQQKLWIKLNGQKSPKGKVIDLRLDGMALID